MGEAVKRRSTKRNKTQKRSAAPLPSHGRSLLSWLKEVGKIFMGVGAVFIAVCLLWFYLVPGSPNIMGPVGHALATLLHGSLGYAGFLIVFGLVAAALIKEKLGGEQIEYSPALRVVAALALLAGFATGLALLSGEYRAGGSIGVSIAAMVMKPFGRGGAWLFSLALIALSSFVLSGQSLSSVGNFTIETGGNLTRWFFITLPATVFDSSAKALGDSVSGLARSAKSLIFVRRVENDEPAPLPKPRVRKNSIEKIVVPEEEEEDEELQVASSRNEPLLIVKPKIASKALEKGAKKGSKEPERVANYSDYSPPELTLLTKEEIGGQSENDDELRAKAEQIEAKLRDFSIAGRVTQVHPGPVITLFEFEPAPGVKVGRIAALQDDLAMTLRASSIRIIAPIPKRGTVGIEVPNKHRNIVRLRDCLESDAFTTAESNLSVPLGKDTYGDAVVVDIATMPHLLMAGSTGTGKSVCINAILLSLLYRAHPADLGLILIDPKVLELSIYEGIPHLRVPVVTDARQAKAVLSWAVKEMDRRYRYMQRFGVRNIDGYNKVVAGTDGETSSGRSTKLPEDVISLSENNIVQAGTVEPAQPDEPITSLAPEQLQPLPKIVIVIDELADLMLSVGREIEDLITRLAQKARAAGIHLIVATQRPSVDVITGLIKANFPARLSFRVSSRIDSRTILDSMGADKLLGKGDMLFMLPGATALKRVHGAFVSDAEVQRVVGHLKAHSQPQYDEHIIAACEKALAEESAESGKNGEEGELEYDPFYDKAVELVVEKGQASTSMIQRAFRIGYNRAARIIEVMEREGIVGPMDGVKPREILVNSGIQE